MGAIKSFIDFLLNIEYCWCCGTTKNVGYYGYADSVYCPPCAERNGFVHYTKEQLSCKCK